MYFVSSSIADYSEKHTSNEPKVLSELRRTTHLKTLMPQMIAGHFQGAFLRMLSRMAQPSKVLEIGTFTGYSAICLCEGLQPNGKLHTIDINDEYSHIQKEYIEKAQRNNDIVRHTGNALDIIPTLPDTFDVVFIDADKINYTNYYNLVFDKVRKGGYIIADNVLWSGKVLTAANEDPDTQALDAYNKMVQADERVFNILLPIRDGIMLAQKL